MVGELKGKRWVSIRCRSVFRASDCRTPCRHQPKLGGGELCTKLMVRVYVPQSTDDKLTEMLGLHHLSAYT